MSNAQNKYAKCQLRSNITINHILQRLGASCDWTLIIISSKLSSLNYSEIVSPYDIDIASSTATRCRNTNHVVAIPIILAFFVMFLWFDSKFSLFLLLNPQ